MSDDWSARAEAWATHWARLAEPARAALLYAAEVGPARAAIVSYVAPAFSIVYGVVLLDESLTVASIAGLVLILAGSWLGAQGRLPRFLSRSEPSRSSAPAPVRAR